MGDRTLRTSNDRFLSTILVDPIQDLFGFLSLKNGIDDFTILFPSGTRDFIVFNIMFSDFLFSLHFFHAFQVIFRWLVHMPYNIMWQSNDFKAHPSRPLSETLDVSERFWGTHFCFGVTFITECGE